MMYELIKIVMANGTVIKWTKEQWDDYKSDGKFFINMDYVISILVK